MSSAISTGRPFFRRLPAIVGVAALAVGMTILAPSALAEPSEPTVSVPATTTLPAGSRLILDSFAVSDTSGEVTVILSTSGSGTLSIQPWGANPTAGSGVTLSGGYSWSGSNVIRFSGTEEAVNEALKWVWVDGATDGDRVSLFVQNADADQSVVYSPDSGHFYEYVASPAIAWLSAHSAAGDRTFGGQSGYLAQIPNAAVNSFVTSKIPGASNVWIGGRASMANPGAQDDVLPDTGVDSEGVLRNWQWVGGPLNGKSFTTCTSQHDNATNCDLATEVFCEGVPPYSSWASGEPNNWSNTERYAVTNWQGSAGSWNDLANTPSGTDKAGGYIVEYGNNLDICGGASTFTGIPLAVTALAIGTGTAATIPGPPQHLFATPLNGSLYLIFDAPATDGGSAVLEYSYSLDGVTWHPLVTTGSTTMSATIGGLTNGTQYVVRVRAINAVGAGSTSTADPVTPSESATTSPSPSPTTTPTSSSGPTATSPSPAPGTTATPAPSPAPTPVTTSSAVPTTSAPIDDPTDDPMTTTAPASIPTNNMTDPVTFTSASVPPAPPALPGVSEANDSSESQLNLSENTVPRNGTFNAIASGFQPGSVVDFYLWSEPVYLGSAIADIHGIAVLPVLLTSEYIGTHHVQSVGTGLLGEPRNLAHPITVIDQLAATGVDFTVPLLLGLQLLLAGVAAIRFAQRRTRGNAGSHA